MGEQDKATDWAEYDAMEPDWPYSPRDEVHQPIRLLGGLDAPFVRDWLGGDATEADVRGLAGVPAGARVTVSGAGKAMLAIAAVGQSKAVSRGGAEVLVRYQTLVHAPLSARSGGKAAQVLKFHYCTIAPPRTGFGTDAIARMVSACEKLGLEEIHGVLAGDGRDEGEVSTGYYAWPAVGFDAALDTWEDSQDRPLPEVLRMTSDGHHVRSLQDLFDAPGGPLWWLQNGSTIAGVFEIRNGSDSRRPLRFATDKLARERRMP